MLNRSRSRTIRVLALCLLAVVIGVSGCKRKAKPEVRLARSGAGTDLASGGAGAFGTNSWAPGGAPDSFDSMGGARMSGGAGAGSGLGSFATDSTGSFPNSASLSGIESGAFIADLEMIHFPFDSDQITPEWQTVLDNHSAWLSGNGGVMVQIEGHTDERGTEEYNVSLGQRRADAVRQYLIEKGVDPNRLSTLSYGKLRPMSWDASEEAHSLNRRAMFLVYAPETGTSTAGF